MTALSLASTVEDISTVLDILAPDVLDGVVLSGRAAKLAKLLDLSLLGEAGWDSKTAVLALPAEHRLLGRSVCRVDGCEASVHPGLPGVCHRCCTRLVGGGLTRSAIAAGAPLPPALPVVDRCAVPGCRCEPTVRQAVLCTPHARAYRQRRPRLSLEQFLADPRVKALAPLPACQVVACTRSADAACGYCSTHYQRWRVARGANPDFDRQSFEEGASGVVEPGQVNLRALPPLVVLEVLFGLSERMRAGSKLTAVDLRALCDTARSHRVSELAEIDPVWLATKAARSLKRGFARDVRPKPIRGTLTQ
jgi:hypothetical protein